MPADLSWNSIGAAGATQLADALRTNTSVKELHLGFNSIGETLEGSIEALLAPAARAQRKADFAWRRRRALLMCVVAARSLQGAGATTDRANSPMTRRVCCCICVRQSRQTDDGACSSLCSTNSLFSASPSARAAALHRVPVYPALSIGHLNQSSSISHVRLIPGYAYPRSRLLFLLIVGDWICDCDRN
jgi:hypothetical protein